MDPDLFSPLADRVGEDAVRGNRGPRQRQAGGNHRELGKKGGTRDRFRKYVGLVVGVDASLLLTRFLQTQLFNVKRSDPATLAAVVAFIATVALVACFLPAHRATRVDPMVVLRDE